MKNLVLILVFLVSATVSFGQISFYKQYSNNGYDYGEGIVQTEDSSYIITGQSSSFLDGPAQAFLLKVDSLGNYLWSWHYGGEESDGGKRVMYIENDGILVAGYTNSFGAGAYDFYLFKTDVLGNELWSETYGSASWDRVTDAALTSDSGVVMIGQTLNTIDGESDILIVRTDKNGQEVWSQQIGGLGEDLANAIDMIDDSTFAVGGKTAVENSDKFKALLFRIQDNGTMLWMDTIGPPTMSCEIMDLAYSSYDNRLALAGMAIFDAGDTTVIENKWNIDGTMVSEGYPTIMSIQYYSGVCNLGQNGKYASVTAYNNEYSYGGFDLLFSKHHNYFGGEASLASINYVGDEILGSIISTSDNGAIAVGSVTVIGEGGANIFIIKMLENGTFFNSNDDFTTNSFVSISEVNTASEISIFPIPAINVLHVTSKNGELLKGSLFDTAGRLVSENALSGVGEINVSFLENGVYFLKIQTSNSKAIHSIKVIVAH